MLLSNDDSMNELAIDYKYAFNTTQELSTWYRYDDTCHLDYAVTQEVNMMIIYVNHYAVVSTTQILHDVAWMENTNAALKSS